MMRMQLDHLVWIVWCIMEVDDGADDAWLAGAVGILDDQRVQAILAHQRVAHPLVTRHHPDPADSPVEADAVVQQPIDVHRLMSAVKTADPEMHDPDADLAAVVVRYGNRQLRQRFPVEFHH
jgi:hypothetical protein